MRHVNLLSEQTAWHLHMFDFDGEIDKILAMHKYIVLTSEREFTAEYDRIMSGPGDGSYDGSDAIWDAERLLGVNPWDVTSHAGLMAVTRAVSLCEVMLARLAASVMTKPDYWVFPTGLLWFREWEQCFFHDVPAAAFKVDGNGFGAVRALRDLYVHGYGIPATDERRDRLAKKLYNQFNTKPVTTEEQDAGYSGEAYFFGDDVAFSPKTQTLEPSGFWASKRADISPLATYRVIRELRAHVHAAHDALTVGVTDEAAFDRSRYKRVVQEWWTEQIRQGKVSAAPADA